MNMMKLFSSLALAAVMSTAISSSAFAADIETQKSAKNDLGSYMETIKENRTTLEQIITDNQKLISQITVLQNQLKQSGILTAEDDATLSDMSSEIQQQNFSIAEKRSEVDSLKASSQENMKSGDVDSAKAKLDEVMNIQNEQIELHEGLNTLLESKLNFLNSYR